LKEEWATSTPRQDALRIYNGLRTRQENYQTIQMGRVENPPCPASPIAHLVARVPDHQLQELVHDYNDEESIASNSQERIAQLLDWPNPRRNVRNTNTNTSNLSPIERILNHEAAQMPLVRQIPAIGEPAGKQ
jgi:hypothetical protein